MNSIASDRETTAFARKRPLITALTTAAVIAGTLMFTSPAAQAHAVDPTVSDVAAAIDNVDGALIEEATGTVTTADSIASAADETGVGVDVPNEATAGVSVTAGDFHLGITLPNAAAAGPATQLESGAIVYPSDEASTNAVIPITGGAQLLSVIDSAAAGEAYEYELSLPDGHRLTATPDGGAAVVDETGATKVVFEPAWATDANGNSVPTHYVVSGATLTQIVEHSTTEGVAYPVVADPLPVIVFVVTAIALIVVAAAALGIATWIVTNWWNQCRAQGKYPELSTKNGFAARCVY